MRTLILLGIIGFASIFSLASADLRCGNTIEQAKQARRPVNDFSRQLYKKIVAAKPDKNIIFSPVSIALALALVENGAAGETQAEFKKLLSPQNQTSEISHFYESLQKTQQSSDENIKLTIANGLFASEDLIFKPEYLKRAKNCYNAEVDKVNFKKTAEALRKINGWVANATADRIPELLSPDAIDENTKSVLTNAIYFKAPWDEKFEVLTDPIDFYKFGRDNEKQRVPFMGRVAKFKYAADADVQYVKIPFSEEKFYFNIMLPKKRDGIQAVEQKTNWTQLRALRQKIAVTKLDLKFPKFTIRTPTKLTEILKQIGLVKAFSNGADFSRMSSQSLAISDVIHEAFIKVNENGTEAAAATAVIHKLRMAAPSAATAPPPIPFIVDHPFSFTITHKDNEVPLFAGKVNFIENTD